MVIIGITGTLGAGKGAIVEYLKEKKGFLHFSARQYIIEEIHKRHLKNNRDSMTLVANDLRANNSPSFIIDELYKKSVESGKNCVIESIRTPGEIISLRKTGNFYLFAIDADAKLRYERIRERKSSTDDIDFETFVKDEQREMTSEDSNKQNLAKCIEMADFKFTNNSSLNELNLEVESVLKKLKL